MKRLATILVVLFAVVTVSNAWLEPSGWTSTMISSASDPDTATDDGYDIEKIWYRYVPDGGNGMHYFRMDLFGDAQQSTEYLFQINNLGDGGGAVNEAKPGTDGDSTSFYVAEALEGNPAPQNIDTILYGNIAFGSASTAGLYTHDGTDNNEGYGINNQFTGAAWPAPGVYQNGGALDNDTTILEWSISGDNLAPGNWHIYGAVMDWGNDATYDVSELILGGHVVPEPATFAMLALLGAGGAAMRKRFGKSDEAEDQVN